LFLSVFGCPCCYRKQDWFTKEKLVSHFGVNEDKVIEIELCAEKERKERETRRNALAIQNFLNFSDVLDFPSHEFKLKNFQKNSIREETLLDLVDFIQSDS
jgi:hypothetical protein